MTGAMQFAGPLRGISVIDLSMWWSAPLSTQLFALMGAEVIKVESIQRVDGWRLAARITPEKGVEGAPNFNGVNLNKLGITLDLSSPEGRDLLRPLVERADALVENYSTRVMANLGLTDEVLFSWNPNLVILSMPGFGIASPWGGYVGFAPTIEQLSGLPELTGYEGGPPSISGNSLADPVAGYTGALALLAALHDRQRTGKGQHVDLSQLEALTALLGHALLVQQFTGEPPPRPGNSHATAFRGCYPCAGTDSWVVISARTDAELAALHREVGLPGESTRESARQNRAAIDDAIQAWTSLRTPAEAAEALQASGVPAGPVLGPATLLADRHLRERGYWVDLDHEVMGRHPHPGLPFHFSRTPGEARQASPTLGRDNRKVLGGSLGLSDEELARLEANGVIGTKPL